MLGRQRTTGKILKGMRILDFTALLPGPYATQILADLGAEVIRVESPKRVDLARFTPPMVTNEISATHAQINRNKSSISLDLKNEDARSIVYDLVKPETGFDIVLEGFRPGVMDRLGLGYNDLLKKNREIIYCSLTGYGQDGPLKDKAGHDINFLALSGLSSYGGGDEPSLSAMQIADIAGGSHHAVIGILAAVIQRMNQRTIMSDSTDVLGQHIDVSMSDCAFALNAMYGASSLYSGNNPERGAEMLTGKLATYNYYKAKCGRHISVGALEPRFAEIFFDTIGHKGWTQRNASDNTLVDDVAAVIAKKSLKEWEKVFDGKDCCVEPVLNLQEAIDHPRTKARGLVQNTPSADGISEFSHITQLALPIKFCNSQMESYRTGGKIGSESEQILKEILNMTDEEIKTLRRNGTVPDT